MIKTKILLASKSPRRSQLLREAGFNFRVETIDVNEDYDADMPAQEVAEFLARKKANAARSLLQNGEVLLTADTIVILGDQILEKPKDHEDAVRMLQTLSGKMHTVLTGICLLDDKKEFSCTDSSQVFIEKLSNAEIDFYIENYKPFDKAGAYGIQEWLGHCKIKNINGSYPNIMGLPVARVYEALVNWAG